VAFLLLNLYKETGRYFAAYYLTVADLKNVRVAVNRDAAIIIEIVTDTICLVFEARRGLAPLAVWRELPKAALTPIVLFVLMFATLAGQMRSLYGQRARPGRRRRSRARCDCCKGAP
jgi:hypothetical protein